MIKVIKSFADDESGTVAIELMLMTPIIVWALISTFVYFDAFRAESISTRAALTVADMISREDTAITPEFLDGTRQMLGFLARSDGRPDLRVTLYTFNDASKKYEVIWSQNRGYGQNLDDSRLGEVAHRLPVLAGGNTSILLETKTLYEPPFDIALAPFNTTELSGLEFDAFTFITPRFAPSICWNATPSNPALEVCG